MTDSLVSIQSRTETDRLVPPPGTFEIDPVHTFVTFRAQHLIVGRVQGRFETVSGAVTVDENVLDSHVEVVIDAASITTQFLAAWSFMLALRSRGLGSVWTTLHVSREKEAGQLLGIPDDVTQVGLLPVAYTLGTDFKAANRQPADEVTYWNTWENTSGPSA